MYIEIIDSEKYKGNVKPGKYQLKKCDSPTNLQNNTFHALLEVYWLSGCYSYDVRNKNDFREAIKYYLGAGVEKFWRTVGIDGKRLEKPVIDYRVKSWSRYTKQERTDTIQNLITEMHAAQVQTKKFYEILQTIEENSMSRVTA